MAVKKTASKGPAHVSSVKVFGTTADVMGSIKDDTVRMLILNELVLGPEADMSALHDRVMKLQSKFGSVRDSDTVSENLKIALGLSATALGHSSNPMNTVPSMNG
jgi:hypothetical protein